MIAIVAFSFERHDYRHILGGSLIGIFHLSSFFFFKLGARDESKTFQIKSHRPSYFRGTFCATWVSDCRLSEDIACL